MMGADDFRCRLEISFESLSPPTDVTPPPVFSRCTPSSLQR